MSEYVDFHYMPLEGKITGKQVLKQTEDAINDLGEHVYELDIDENRIDEAVEKSNQAIETADAALSAVTTDRAVWKNTVAEMKATDIDLGVTAATRGKMVFNDGNGAFYGVRSEKSGDVDSDDTVFLNNGNVAERIQSMNVIAKGNNIIFVANVAELIDSDALIGNVYGTAGYYSANDGGSALYTIREKLGSDLDDGGSIIFLNNGNVAELITDGTVNVKQFGACGDGLANDTTAIQNAINFANLKVIIPNGTYKLLSTITVDKDIDIDFNDSVIYTSAATAIVCTGSLVASTSATAYNNITDKNSITVADATGFEVGYIINITSSDSYNSNRPSYIKGANAIITNIVGKKVYFSLTSLGYDMSTDIVVKCYEPISANISNIKLLQCTLSLADTVCGIEMKYVINSTLSRIKTDNFKCNIRFSRSVNGYIKDCETARAKSLASQGWDGYGIAISSSTGINIVGVIANSGQHGITTGGLEPNYNISISDSFVKSEYGDQGLGCHEDTASILISNCELYGAWFAGNYVSAYNSRIKARDNNGNVILSSGNSDVKPNYYFENCSFAGLNNAICSINIMSYITTGGTLATAVGNVIFNNCSNLLVGAIQAYNYSDLSKALTIEKIELNKCENCQITISDNLGALIIDNCITYGNRSFLYQMAVGGNYGLIKRILVRNSFLPTRYNTFQIYNATDVVFESLYFDSTSSELSSASFTLSNISKLTLLNFDNSVMGRGNTVTNIGEFSASNSNYKSYQNLTTFLSQITSCNARNFTFNGTKEDIWTSGGNKYTVTIGSSGFTVTQQ